MGHRSAVNLSHDIAGYEPKYRSNYGSCPDVSRKERSRA